MIFFYLNNFLLIAPRHRQRNIDTLKPMLDEKYGIKDLGPATPFLNINIVRNINARKL